MSIRSLGFWLLLLFSWQSLYGQAESLITVYHDVNNNSVREADEELVPGIVFVAFTADDESREIVDNGDGTYTLLSDERVRVEVMSVPSGFLNGKSGSTSVFFADPGGSYSVAVITDPSDGRLNDTIIFDSFNIVITCYESGAAQSKIGNPALISYPTDVDGIAQGQGGSETNPTALASIDQIGSTWGVAFDNINRRLVTSALTKRHVGFGPHGAGGLYVYEYLEDTTLSYNLSGLVPTVGPALDLGSVQRSVVSGLANGPYELSLDSTQSFDVDAFGKVGQTGYGDIEYLDDNEEVWMVNLNQRSLIVLNSEEEGLDLSSVRHYPIEGLPGMPDNNFSLIRTINTGRLSETGSISLRSEDGTLWEKNKYQVEGELLYTNASVSGISDAATEEVYQNYSTGLRIAYEIPLPNDVYEVTLHFAEMSSYGVDDRLMDIFMEGTQFADNFDIVASAGGSRRATSITFSVTVADGILDLELLGETGSATSRALLSGVMVKGSREMESGVLRPWGLGFDDTGKGYLGLVNDASFSGSRDHLYAYVLTFDPDNINAGFETVMKFSLGYRREKVSYANDPEPRSFRTSDWEVWVNDWSQLHYPSDIMRMQAGYPQAIVSDIEFDSLGNMIIGLMDRWGHQVGYENYNADLDAILNASRSSDRQLIYGYSAGDVLKACKTASGYELECENSDPGVNYMADDGPSAQGEFFYEDNFTITQANHGETFTGGMTVMKASQEVVASVLNPIIVPNSNPSFEQSGIFSQGVHFYDTEEGDKERAYLFIDQFQFGKANGLGDMEMADLSEVTIQAPNFDFEIGNYIWVDSDKDGIQDADEPGIPNVVVSLFCTDDQSLVSITLTDSLGRYIFSNVESFKCYEIRVDLSQVAFLGLEREVTQSNAGSNDNIDSDALGDLIPGFAVIPYCTNIVNRNDHSLDIGINGPVALDAEDIVCADSSGMVPPEGTFDLTNIASRVDTTGLNGIAFYLTEEDAIAEINALASPYVSTSGMIVARVNSAINSDFYSLANVTLTVVDGAISQDFPVIVCPTETINLEEIISISLTNLEIREQPSNTLVPSPASYTVSTLPMTLSYTGMNGRCMVDGSIELTRLPIPQVVLLDSGEVCEGEDYNLSALSPRFNANGSGATLARWATSGTGSFVPSDRFGEAIRYRPSAADLNSPGVEISLTVEDYTCSDTTVSDTSILVFDTLCPRCPTSLNCIAGINFPCGVRITLDDVLTSPIRDVDRIFYTMTITDGNGFPISNPIPIDYEGEIIITVSVTPECGGMTCQTRGQIKKDLACEYFDQLDTAVWCIDPFLELDPRDEDYYPFKPEARTRCEGRELDMVFETDHTITFEDSDTSKMILRCWYVDDPKGELNCRVCDTIIVWKLPLLGPDNLIVPQKDTFSCELDTQVTLKPTYDYYCWKELVGLHSNKTEIRYPKDRIREIIASGSMDAAIEYRLSQIPLIIRAQDSITVFDTVRFSSSDDDLDFLYEVRLGDLILSTDGSYIEVDLNWFYDPESRGFWIDLCIPTVKISRDTTICDIWESGYCENGVQLLLPNRPVDPDSCSVYCLTADLLDSTKCCVTIHAEAKELSSSCPVVEKRDIEIKQLCYAENVPDVPSNCELTSDGSGISSNDGEGYLTIEQWIMKVDTIAPLIQEIKGSRIANVEENSCRVSVPVPAISFKDQCSGVKAVKAMIGGKFISLVLGADGFWYQAEDDEVVLPYSGSIDITYEAMDSCHNTVVVDEVEISVYDRVPPTVMVDDELRVSLGGKAVEINARDLVQDIVENCSVRTVLARRKDWTNCVDLCSDALDSIDSYDELRTFLQNGGIESVLDQGMAEDFYREAYEWIRDDGEWCEDVPDLLLQGWEDEILAYWSEECGLEDEHGNALNPKENSLLGGGWSRYVPVYCKDACEEIVVEILVVDDFCNFNRSWIILSPEDKSAVGRYQDFEDVHISCSAYSDLYLDAVQRAFEAGNSSEIAPEEFGALDEFFGAFQKGWLGNDNTLTDEFGEVLNLEASIGDLVCADVIDTSIHKVIGHDGRESKVYVFDTSTVLAPVSDQVQLGAAHVLCGARCVQDVWIDLDDCGKGTVTRRWRVYSGCAGHSDEVPLVFNQVIHVSPSCDIKRSMFSLPTDTTLACTSLSIGEDGNADLDAGELFFELQDRSCRKLGIGYEDQILEIVGQENAYKVERVWSIDDWCSGTSWEYTQNIKVFDSCDDEGSRRVLMHFMKMDEEPIEDVQLEMVNMGTGRRSTTSAENSSLELFVNEARDYTFTPSKDGNPTEGVTLIDVDLLTDFILGRSDLSEIQKLAADVNRDGVLNSKDVIIMQQLLAGTREDIGGESWRWLHHISGDDYAYLYAGLDSVEFDFLGVKMGDLDFLEEVEMSAYTSNFTYSRAEDGGSVSYSFGLTEETELEVAHFKIRVPEEVQSVYGPDGKELKIWTQDQTGVLSLILNTKLLQGGENDALAAGKELFSLLCVAKHGEVSEGGNVIVDYGSTTVENGQLKAMAITSLDEANRFELFAVHPNPASDILTIPFYSSEDTNIELHIRDVLGRTVLRSSRSFERGYQGWVVDVSAFGGASEVYYFSITSNEQLESGTFILAR